MAAILNSANLHSAILVSPLKLTHICQERFPLFTPRRTLTHSFWLNLMMAAILKSAMLDSDTAILYSGTLLSSLRSTPKHSPSTLTLTQTNSIWLTWWWQPSWIRPFCTKLWLNLIQLDSNPFILTELDDGSHLEFCHLGFRHFAQNNLHLFILTQLDDGSHLEFCHVVFSHLSFSSQTHSHLLRMVPPLAQKNFTHTSLPTICIKNFTHSFWLNLMMAAILNSFLLDSSILVFPIKLTHTWLDWSHHRHKKNFTQFPPHHLHKKLHLFILTLLDDGSHLEFCHVYSATAILVFRHLVIFSQIYSKTLSLHSDSDSN